MTSLWAALRTAAVQLPQEGHGESVQGHETGFDLGEMLAHHILNAPKYELPWGEASLPHWNPVSLGGFHVDLSPTKHSVLMLLAAAITTVATLAVARTVASRGASGRAPSGFANAVEAVVVFFRDDVCKGNIGPGYQRFVPFVLTLFFFILTMNLLGLLPWGGTATGNLTVTASLAVVTFFVTEISGFRALGFAGYMRTIFFAPPGMSGIGKFLILCLMTPVELLGKFTKPFALAIRLFANMTAGHMLIFSLLGLIFVFADLYAGNWLVVGGVAGASFVMVSLIMLMELLIALIQAYVFAMLSAVFIGLMQHEH